MLSTVAIPALLLVQIVTEASGIHYAATAKEDNSARQDNQHNSINACHDTTFTHSSKDTSYNLSMLGTMLNHNDNPEINCVHSGNNHHDDNYYQ